jgi:hypothetical protein
VTTFEPRVDILPRPQRELWAELDAVPSDFVLYGGTPLALQLGHRASEDFDFSLPPGLSPTFCNPPFFAAAEESRSRSSGMSDLRRVQDPRRPVGSRVQVASLIDLAGMEMRVIQMRGSWKDYVDIHALASNGVDVCTALAAGTAIDSRFNRKSACAHCSSVVMAT